MKKKIILLSALLFIFLVAWNRFVPSRNHPDKEQVGKIWKQYGSETVLVVDFSKPSCQDRLYIYDSDASVVYTGPVLHGCGGKSTARTPQFSNKIGSHCSSLGLYQLTKVSRMTVGYPCIKLRGLSPTNSNAEVRGIYIHPSFMVSLLPFEIYGASFPLTHASEGCFTVSWQTFRKIEKLLKDNKNIKLYAFI